MGSRVTRFLGILSHEPAVGKTTTVVNLATLLCEAGKRVLVLDCTEDLVASRLLGFRTDIGEMWDGDQVVTAPASANLGILPLAARPENASGSARSAAFDPANLRSSCADWDYVVVDLPDTEQVDEGLFQVLDRVIILILSREFSLPQLAGIVNVVTDIKGRFNPSLEIEGVLITLADRALEEYERTMQAAGRHFPVDVFPFAIPHDEAFVGGEQDPACGLEAALGSRATRGYVELAMEVLSHER